MGYFLYKFSAASACSSGFFQITRHAMFSSLTRPRSMLYCILGSAVFTVFAYLSIFAVSPAMGLEGKMSNDSKKVVRKALGAGRWFPKNSKKLKSMVDGYIENAVVEKAEGRIVGGIAPHAGYIYSGKAAGYTFRAIKENVLAGYRPETVVVLGIRHRGGFTGVALMDGDAIETPLGQTILDKKAGRMMAAQSQRIFFDYRPHVDEHSAENLIPFVQSSLPGVEMVVGLIGDHDPKTLKALVSVLCELAKEKKIMVLASSDMLHDPDYNLVTRTDKKTLEKVKVMDYAAINRDWKVSRQLFCGIGPVLAVMRFAELQGCRKGTVLHYRNSGDDFPESRGRWVVGYSSVVFVTPE